MPAYLVIMPTILAFHLMVLSTTGAIVLRENKYEKVSLLVVIILSCSATSTYGVVNQLFSQVHGLSLLVACTNLLIDSRFEKSKKTRDTFQYCILLSLLLSTLLIAYPEISPFVFLSLLNLFNNALSSKKN